MKIYLFKGMLILFILLGCKPKIEINNTLYPIEKKALSTNVLKADSITENNIDSNCSIDIHQKTFEKEYTCYVFIFKFENKIIYIDSNTQYTTTYYPIQNNMDSLKIFDYYASPTGRRKLLLFNTQKAEILISNWFDDGALGDSIDIESINLNNNTFVVWTNQDGNIKSYFVKLNQLKSW